MPSINFQRQFSGSVERGLKRCTIRAKRKHPIKAGDTLFLYTGMRSPGCRKLGQHRCTKVTPIVIDGINVFLNDRDLTASEVVALATRDGFVRMEDFWAFFHREDGPFEGDLIEW